MADVVTLPPNKEVLTLLNFKPIVIITTVGKDEKIEITSEYV